MAKKVCKASTVVLGGVDVSEYVQRWAVIGVTGDIYKCELTLLDSPDLVSITPNARAGSARNLRVARDDKIVIKGVDVSAWVYEYGRIARVGECDVVEIHLQADKDILTINGVHLWEE